MLVLHCFGTILDEIECLETRYEHVRNKLQAMFPFEQIVKSKQLIAVAGKSIYLQHITVSN